VFAPIEEQERVTATVECWEIQLVEARAAHWHPCGAGAPLVPRRGGFLADRPPGESAASRLPPRRPSSSGGQASAGGSPCPPTWSWTGHQRNTLDFLIVVANQSWNQHGGNTTSMTCATETSGRVVWVQRRGKWY
jgi:hypothetical protein